MKLAKKKTSVEIKDVITGIANENTLMNLASSTGKARPSNVDDDREL